MLAGLTPLLCAASTGPLEPQSPAEFRKRLEDAKPETKPHRLTALKVRFGVAWGDEEPAEGIPLPGACCSPTHRSSWDRSTGDRVGGIVTIASGEEWQVLHRDISDHEVVRRSVLGRGITAEPGMVSALTGSRAGAMADVMAIADIALFSAAPIVQAGKRLVRRATAVGRALGHGANLKEVRTKLEELESEEAVEVDAHGEFGPGGTASAAQVGYGVANLIVGGAVFTVPYALKVGGWSSLPVVLLSVAAMYFSAQLLGEVLEAAEARGYASPSFGVVGELTFGPAFGPIFTLFCVGEVFFNCIFFLLFVSHTLSAVVLVPVRALVPVCALVGVLLHMVPRRYFSVLSVLGLSFTLAAAAAVVGSGLELLPDSASTGQSAFGTGGAVAGGVMTLSAVAMGCGDHAVFPGIYAGSQDPGSYRRGMQLGFLAFGVLAALLCAVAYATFGSALNPVALTNIGLDGDGRHFAGVPGVLRTTANTALALRSLTVMPVFMKPVLTSVGGAFGRLLRADVALPPGAESDLDLLKESKGRARFAARLVMTCVVWGLAAALGVALADLLAELETLMCSFFKSVNVFVIPACGYLTICRSDLRQRPLQAVAAVLLLVLGVSWGIVGSTAAAKAMLAHGAAR